VSSNPRHKTFPDQASPEEAEKELLDTSVTRPEAAPDRRIDTHTQTLGYGATLDRVVDPTIQGAEGVATVAESTNTPGHKAPADQASPEEAENELLLQTTETQPSESVSSQKTVPALQEAEGEVAAAGETKGEAELSATNKTTKKTRAS
jgi:hypothetical protein